MTGSESLLAPTDPAPDRYRWVILVVATLVQTGTAFVFLGVGALAGFIQEDFNLSGTQTGLLITAVGLAPLAGLLPTGRMLDRGHERLMITGGALVLAAGASLAAGVGTYLPVLMLLFLGGAGYSASQPGGSKVVAAWFPAHQRGLAMGIRQTGLPLGGALAAAILPALADRRNWQIALLVAAGVTASTGIAFGLAYRPGRRSSTSTGLRFRSELRRLLSTKSIRLAMLAGLGMVAIQFSMISYLMLYARDVHGIPLTRGAWMLFGAQGAGVLGRIVLAAWSDRIRSRMTPVIIAAAAAGLGAVTLGFLSGDPTFAILASLSVVVGFFAFGWYGPWVVFVAESAPGHAVGLTLALAMTANQLAIVVAPPVFGLLLDLSGGYTVPWLVMGGFLVAVAARIGIGYRSSVPSPSLTSPG